MAKDSLFVGAMDSAPIKGNKNTATGSCTYNGEAGYQKRTKSSRQLEEVNRVTGSRLQNPTRKG